MEVNKCHDMNKCIGACVKQRMHSGMQYVLQSTYCNPLDRRLPSPKEDRHRHILRAPRMIIVMLTL